MTIRGFNAASALGIVVALPTASACGLYAYQHFSAQFRPSIVALLTWVVLIAAVELLPAPAWGGVQVSLGFPLLTAVSILYPPGVAAVVALVGSFDPREIRRQVGPLRALFNRSQVALAVFAASSVFHRYSDVSEKLHLMIPAALLATVVDYAINIGLVTVGASLMLRIPALTVLRSLSRGQEFLFSYAGLGIVGAVLAKLYLFIGFWSVVTILAPLLFARQMFRRSTALEEAHEELKVREQVLRQLSNAMAEERADERLQIAGYLHDDLAQVLFRLSIQVDVARKLLNKGDYREVMTQLEKIRDSKQETSDRIRALIRDLHRSPLGAKGLAEALESFTDEVGRDSNIRFHRDVADIDLPAPIALLVYHIAREGVMNALKHAQATDVWIRVQEADDQIELQLRDNGVGFDMSLPGPEGHFGMAMMRERAQVGGGTLDVESAPDEGATITVRFPIALLQQEPGPADQQNGSDGAPGADAFPGTSGRGATAADGSRQAVRA
jgi:signal transduction histidine kinase